MHPAARAAEPDPIGKFTSLTQKEDDPISITGPQGKRSACVGCLLYQGDTIQTKKKQLATFELDDGSVIDLGSQAQLTLENWSDKDSQGLLKRSLSLTRGALRALVNRVYSTKEPFLLKTKNAIMGVRGTEFVATINSERLVGREKEPTTTLFTVTGEVHFAKSESDFAEGRAVIAHAGYRSVIARGMDVPTTPVQYKPAALNRVIKERVAQIKTVRIQKTEKYDVLGARAGSVLSPGGQKTERRDASISGARPNPAVPGRQKPQIHQPSREGRVQERNQAVRSLRPGGPNEEVLSDEAKAKNFSASRQQRGKAGTEYQAPQSPNSTHAHTPKPPLAGSGFQRMMPGSPGSTSRPPGQTPGARNAVHPRPRPGEQQILRKRPPPPLLQAPPPPGP